jgi:hypothetical protein
MTLYSVIREAGAGFLDGSAWADLASGEAICINRAASLHPGVARDHGSDGLLLECRGRCGPATRAS